MNSSPTDFLCIRDDSLIKCDGISGEVTEGYPMLCHAERELHFQRALQQLKFAGDASVAKLLLGAIQGASYHL